MALTKEERQLRDAALSGNTATVRRLVLNGVNPNCFGESHRGPLHEAIIQGHMDIVRILITTGADVNMLADNRYTPLRFAASCNRKAIAKLLLLAGANASAKSRSKKTPFHYAQEKSYGDVAELLAEHMRRQTEAKLMEAVKRRAIPDAMAILLEDATIRVHNTECVGGTNKKCAHCVNSTNETEIQLPVIDPNVRDQRGTPLIIRILETGDTKLLQALVANPLFNVDARDERTNDSALGRAIATKAKDAVSLLLQAGARLEEDQVTALVQVLGSVRDPLVHAVRAGNTLFALLQAATTEDVVAARQEAIANGRDVIAAALTHDGSHRLGSSTRAKITEMLATAVQKGVYTKADKTALLQSLGKTPTQLQHEMAQRILVAAVTCDHVPLVIELLHAASSRPLNTVSSNGPSPLHVAAKSASMGMLYVLLTQDLANINAINEEGYTPLAIAVQEGRPDVAALLLSVGADVSTQLSDHAPLLHLAITTGSCLQLLELSLSAPRVDINQTDKDGYTALAKAVVTGHEAATTRLVEKGADVWTLLPNGQTLLAAAIQHHQHAIASVLYARMYPGTTQASILDITIVDCMARQRNDVVVHKATYAGKTVVLKGPQFPTKRVVDAMRNEAQEMQGCTSPYVQPLIGILDNGSSAPLVTPSGDALYSPTMIIEYMDGGDLHETLEKTRLGLNVVLHVSISEVALVLAYALRDLHALGKVHRDVKSHNIFLSSTYYIRLGDLGSARTLDGCMTSNVGTSLWIAPEVARAGAGDTGRSYGPPADIYSFGVVLTELDTRETPYADVQDQSLIPAQVRDGKLRPKMSATCAPWLQALADQCLATNPADRPTAVDIIATLLAHRHDDTPTASPP